MPIDWPEPFGLVMIEAMACGTPVIAFSAGSVPEIVEDGVTGFIVEDEVGAADAMRRSAAVPFAAKIRARFEERFTAQRMARIIWRSTRAVAAHKRRRGCGFVD